MITKHFIPVLLFALNITIVAPVFAGNERPTTTSETPKEKLANKIETRLREIKNMDVSNLTRAEKKDLRKEVKEMKRERSHAGIYLSVGAIIIIVLLLILLL